MLSWVGMKAVPANALLEIVKSPETDILDTCALTADMLFSVKIHPLKCIVD